MFEKQTDKFSLTIDEVGGNESFSIQEALRPVMGEWHEQEAEGQLSVDVGQNDEELIIVATMAGALSEDIELHLHNDLLTIRGMRRSPLENSIQHFYQECYWGKFSRTIVLPVDVKGEMSQAQYKNGVLIIRLPKAKANEEIPIMVIED